MCGTNPTVTKLIDYEQFCGLRPEPQQAQATGAAVSDWEITPVELKKKLDAGRDAVHPRRARAERVPDQPDRRLDADSARRAAAAVSGAADATARSSRSARWAAAAPRRMEFLKSVGFTNVKNLKGGILEWIDKVDPSQPKY